MDNTVIIYTGDQGFMLGEHDYQDKRWMYEESQRMPFLIRYPKAIKAGTRSDAIIENVDFAPTMLDFAGVARHPTTCRGAVSRRSARPASEPDGLEEGGLLPLLDAHGPPRQPRPRRHPHQDTQADLLLRVQTIRAATAHRPPGNSTICKQTRTSSSTSTTIRRTQRSRPA